MAKYVAPAVACMQQILCTGLSELTSSSNVSRQRRQASCKLTPIQHQAAQRQRLLPCTVYPACLVKKGEWLGVNKPFFISSGTLWTSVPWGRIYTSQPTQPNPTCHPTCEPTQPASPISHARRPLLACCTARASAAQALGARARLRAQTRFRARGFWAAGPTWPSQVARGNPGGKRNGGNRKGKPEASTHEHQKGNFIEKRKASPDFWREASRTQHHTLNRGPDWTPRNILPMPA